MTADNNSDYVPKYLAYIGILRTVMKRLACAFFFHLGYQLKLALTVTVALCFYNIFKIQIV